MADGMQHLEPISDDNAAIEAAIREAHLPSLIAALVHLTGDMSLVRSDILPVYDMFGDGQGGLTEEQIDRVRSEALQAISAYRDRGGTLPGQPSKNDIFDIMSFVAGGPIPEHYVPFLMEELALNTEDAKAGDWIKPVSADKTQNFRVLIIGAGMSGILAAIRLGQAGIPYTIIEKNADVGGTWLENTYPGCRVDNPNHMYSYSFEPNHGWPQHYSTQDVLLDYFRRIADKYGIRKHIRFETTVDNANFDEGSGHWSVSVKTKDGKSENLTGNALITAVGQLNRPKLPDIPGIDRFTGPAFHSATWDHSVDLKGKRVAVIGTGASAFQFVPEIASEVGHLTVFQRTPPWLGPTPNYHDDVSEGMKWLLRHVPYYAKWYRFFLFWMLTDGIYEAVKADDGWNGGPNSVGELNLELRTALEGYAAEIAGDDQDLLSKIVPNYPPGGKRSVRDNGVWTAALRRDNVDVITSPITEITEQGVCTEDGQEHRVDVLIYGTGFHASRFLWPMTINGKDQKEIHEAWSGDARAFLGITVPGYPNLFMMYGPNTNIVVNGSIIFFSECEIRYILGCLKLLVEDGHNTLEVKQSVHDAFNKKVDETNAKMAWGSPYVNSWYKSESGRVSQNWPFPIVEYWQATRAPNPEDFDLR